jgi:hypothetical protein
MAGEAGTAGEGGMGATGPGADCTTCIDGGDQTSPQAVLLDQCADSPPCSTWLACVRGCSDDDCLDDCDAASPAVAPYRYAIYDALCDACNTECSVLALCDRGCVDSIDLPDLSMAPATLAETGLYTASGAAPTEVAPYARSFRPEYELWSDGAQKQRWVYLPACGRIGTEGINHWLVPQGTRFWKEFVIPSTGGNAGVRVETRFMHKFGPGDADWLFATYQWPENNASPTAGDATLVTAGVPNANGTTHDIPSVAQCSQCHFQNLVERVLGFGAIQLSHELGGVTIRELADAGWLTHPQAAAAAGGGLARNGFDPPGSEAAQRALGYLHANCGNCHHMGTVFGQDATNNIPPARLRLMVGMNTVESTDTYTSFVGIPTLRPYFAGCDRIEPGRADLSEMIMRMNRRDMPQPGQQMPPLATKQVHMDAVGYVSAWIDSLPAAGGVPTCVPPP